MIKFEHAEEVGENTFFYLHARDISEVHEANGINYLRICTYQSGTHYSCSDHQEIVKAIDLCLSKEN